MLQFVSKYFKYILQKANIRLLSLFQYCKQCVSFQNIKYLNYLQEKLIKFDGYVLLKQSILEINIITDDKYIYENAFIKQLKNICNLQRKLGQRIGFTQTIELESSIILQDLNI